MTSAPVYEEAHLAGARFSDVPACLVSTKLSAVPGVTHGITRRVIGLGAADGNVGYSAPRDTDDAWRMRQRWFESVGLDAESIVVAHQVHGAGVAIVGAGDAGRGARPASGSIGQADALVTNEPGVALMTLHADCLAILLCDPVRKVVATVHAGWRGTVAGVTAATVRTMASRFGTEPAHVLGYLGPAIGSCCYEVGSEVVDAWRTGPYDQNPMAVRVSANRDGHWTFDLALANRLQLEGAGLSAVNIEESRICTRCRGDEWFSHRGQGPLTGRYGSFIALNSPMSGAA